MLNITKRGGDKMVSKMNEKSVVMFLIDFYLENKSPFYEKDHKRNSMGNRFKSPKFEPLIDFVCYVLSFADLSFMQPLYGKLQEKLKLPKPLYNLQEDDKMCVQCKEFLEKTILQRLCNTFFCRSYDYNML